MIFAGIPGFQYREESLTEVVGRTWPKMFWLALLAVAAYAAAVRGSAGTIYVNFFTFVGM